MVVQHVSCLLQITYLNDTNVTTVRARPMRDKTTPMVDIMFNASSSPLERGWQSSVLVQMSYKECHRQQIQKNPIKNVLVNQALFKQVNIPQGRQSWSDDYRDSEQSHFQRFLFHNPQ